MFHAPVIMSKVSIFKRFLSLYDLFILCIHVYKIPRLRNDNNIDSLEDILKSHIAKKSKK